MTDYPPQALTNAAAAIEQVLGRCPAISYRQVRELAQEAAAEALTAAAALIEDAARQDGIAEGADRSAAWLAGPDGARALAELAGKLVADAVAAERQRIREEAVAVGATYQPCPCDPARGIGDPEHGPVPFADLLGGES